MMVMQKIVKVVMVGMLGCVVVGMHGAANVPAILLKQTFLTRGAALLKQTLLKRGDEYRVADKLYHIESDIRTTENTVVDFRPTQRIVRTWAYSRPVLAGLVTERITEIEGYQLYVEDLNQSRPASSRTYWPTTKGCAVLLGTAAVVAAYARPDLIKRAFNRVMGWFGR